MSFKAIKDFLGSEFLGPYPYFWEEKELRSTTDGKPEFRYALWVSPSRFKRTILIDISTSRENFDGLKEEWRKHLQELGNASLKQRE